LFREVRFLLAVAGISGLYLRDPCGVLIGLPELK